MIKFRLYYDKDKETEWLNGLANEGWAMKGFFAGFYSFEPCEKGEYTYQIDFSNKAVLYPRIIVILWTKQILKLYKHGFSGYSFEKRKLMEILNCIRMSILKLSIIKKY